MAPAGRIAAGTVIPRGAHSEMHYNGGGSAVMFHTDARGVQQKFFEQKSFQFSDGRSGFHRDYVFDGQTVGRDYYPVAWGNSGYVFYGYHPVFQAAWALGIEWSFGAFNVRYEGGYYGWCHDSRYWNAGWEFGYHYGWAEEGWHAHPWFGYYGYYFPLYPEYSSPSHWVMDWYYGTLLSDYYDIREAEMSSVYYDSYALDFNTKETIRLEVEQAMLQQQSSDVVAVSNYLNTSHLYVVSEYTPVLTADGYTCSLSHGDVIEQSGTSYEGQETLNMLVVRSKRGSCYPNSIIQLDVSQLQEYQSDFNARIETGMTRMHERFWR